MFADHGCQGAIKRAQATGVNWHVAMRPGKRRTLNKSSLLESLMDKAEQLKASVLAKVEHLLRVIKCQFGFNKVRDTGLDKKTAKLITMFALVRYDDCRWQDQGGNSLAARDDQGQASMHAQCL